MLEQEKIDIYDIIKELNKITINDVPLIYPEKGMKDYSNVRDKCSGEYLKSIIDIFKKLSSPDKFKNVKKSFQDIKEKSPRDYYNILYIVTLLSKVGPEFAQFMNPNNCKDPDNEYCKFLEALKEENEIFAANEAKLKNDKSGENSGPQPGEN